MNGGSQHGSLSKNAVNRSGSRIPEHSTAVTGGGRYFSQRAGRQWRWMQTLLTLVVLATCVRVWVGPAEILKRADAQILDPREQRKLVLDEAKRTNQLLAEIKELLAAKVLNVRIVGADNKAGGRSVPPSTGP